ncbi:outer membrane putative beta-barrel porin/alpha-amylase [Stenotrophomonas rhizophila]|uniref:transporter n=1 Tax=Stenotrophomonas rhizophila TaxID=216778 RepID=UPI000F4CD88F|nr:transporter [Stenotrophomonas rhizophila]ROP77178.1 outer membrane putative beta-barrel porin/alpha-amylase [Stenotrophomonas rhizophila]
MRCSALLLSLLFCGAVHAQQDAPPDIAFDRPGIGFAAWTLPRGSIALEAGLLSFSRDRDDAGVLSTQYSADITLRIGVAEHLELQAFTSPWNHLRVAPRDTPAERSSGAGDVGVGLKVALPLSSEKHAVALLASTTFATGSRDFSEGATQYALGASYEYDVDDRWTGALYANLTRGGSEDSVTWAPSVSFAATDTVSTYLEVGFTDTHGEPSSRIAGAGVTWMVKPRVQLDASFDVGLNDDSPDIQAGLGVSVYFE